MTHKLIKKGQLLTVRGSEGQGLTARGRTMRSPIEQQVPFKSPNRYEGLYLVHVAGPLKGVHIKFTTALARKATVQAVCLCKAYLYPHRTGKGQCQKIETTQKQ